MTGGVDTKFGGDSSGAKQAADDVIKKFEEVATKSARLKAALADVNVTSNLTKEQFAALSRASKETSGSLEKMTASKDHLREVADKLDQRLGRMQIAIGGISQAAGTAGGRVQEMVGGAADLAMAAATGGLAFAGLSAAMAVANKVMEAQIEAERKLDEAWKNALGPAVALRNAQNDLAKSSANDLEVARAQAADPAHAGMIAARIRGEQAIKKAQEERTKAAQALNAKEAASYAELAQKINAAFAASGAALPIDAIRRMEAERKTAFEEATRDEQAAIKTLDAGIKSTKTYAENLQGIAAAELARAAVEEEIGARRARRASEEIANLLRIKGIIEGTQLTIPSPQAAAPTSASFSDLTDVDTGSMRLPLPPSIGPNRTLRLNQDASSTDAYLQLRTPASLLYEPNNGFQDPREIAPIVLGESQRTMVAGGVAAGMQVGGPMLGQLAGIHYSGEHHTDRQMMNAAADALAGGAGSVAQGAVGGSMFGAIGGAAGGALGGAVGGPLGAVIAGPLGSAIGSIVDSFAPLMDSFKVLGGAVSAVIHTLEPLFSVGNLIATSFAQSIEAVAPLFLALTKPLASCLLVLARFWQTLLPFVDIITQSASVVLGWTEGFVALVEVFDRYVMLPLVTGATMVYNAFVGFYNATIQLIRQIPGMEHFGTLADQRSAYVGFAPPLEDPAHKKTTQDNTTALVKLTDSFNRYMQNLPSGFKLGAFEYAAASPGSPGGGGGGGSSGAQGRGAPNVTIQNWVGTGDLRTDMARLRQTARVGAPGRNQQSRYPRGTGDDFN